MHDPMTVAHEIKNPFAKKDGGYRPSLITIWHVDPEKDGTDDSCGWFMRARHGDEELLKKIIREFDFNFQHNYWFDEDKKPKFSVSAIVLNMYEVVLWNYYKHDRSKIKSFFRKHLAGILLFAENPTDSLSDTITGRWGFEKADHYARVIYGDILRKNQKWYQHPRWHIHHWKLQFHPYRELKRRYWDKCSVCGKRGFKGSGSAHTNWSGTEIWHAECDKNNRRVVTPEGVLS
jgi:hypothetical protein